MNTTCTTLQPHTLNITTIKPQLIELPNYYKNPINELLVLNAATQLLPKHN